MTQIKPLLDIMARLRDPASGCPWDLEQNFVTIAPYTIEEAYEVAEAIAHGNRAELKDELGDLLLQVVFHSQMAAEEGSFTFADVVEAICAKMIRRHPHVFGEATIATAEAQTANWEAIKQAERAGKQQVRALDGVPTALPALMRAQKLQARAARVGFDWPEVSGVLAKIREELAEIEEAIASGDTAHQHEELGDLLFAASNLARFIGSDAETALRDANAKFTRRFEQVETAVLASGKTLPEATLEEMEAHWQAAKAKE